MELLYKKGSGFCIEDSLHLELVQLIFPLLIPRHQNVSHLFCLNCLYQQFPQIIYSQFPSHHLQLHHLRIHLHYLITLLQIQLLSFFSFFLSFISFYQISPFQLVQLDDLDFSYQFSSSLSYKQSQIIHPIKYLFLFLFLLLQLIHPRIIWQLCAYLVDQLWLYILSLWPFVQIVLMGTKFIEVFLHLKK